MPGSGNAQEVKLRGSEQLGGEWQHTNVAGPLDDFAGPIKVAPEQVGADAALVHQDADLAHPINPKYSPIYGDVGTYGTRRPS